MPKKVTVVTDINGPEALYVDGVLKFQSETVYATDIASIAGGEPIILEHRCCEFDADFWEWPEKLEDVPLENTNPKETT